MSKQQRTLGFEDDVRRAIRSYAEEGARAFDPGRISAQARAAGAGARWWPTRTRRLELPLLRFALLVVLLGVAVAGLAVVGSRLMTSPPLPGVLAVAAMDQILVVDPSSGTSDEITDPTPHDAYPVWSPDGTRLALSQHDGRGTVQLIDADGGNRHSIVDDLTSGSPVAWSPDGSRIAFAGYHYPGGGEPGLYLVDADGTSLTLLVPGTGAWGIGRLSWSPDGSTIAFVAGIVEDQSNVLRGFVKVVDVASGDVSVVSTSSQVRVMQDAPLAWRPGRMELLYAQQSKQSGEAGPEDIVLAERVGDAWQERPLVTDLRPGEVTYPMWLDGDSFAHVRDNRLWVAHLDGRPEVPIGEQALHPLGPGCVAPDGSAVAVLVADGGTEEEPKNALLLVPTDGGPTIRTVTGWVEPSAPACSWHAVRP